MSRLDDVADRVTIVVSSCDAFFDAWRPFAFFFREFWRDCPFDVRLVVNQLEVRSSFIRTIRVGEDKGWATNMQVALQQIATPYILYFQEDYFLTRPPDAEQLARDIEFALQEDAASLCFRDLSGLEPQLSQPPDRVTLVPAESKGRTRLQATLWKRDALAQLLRPGETAWDMEARGSERARDLRMFAYTRNDEAPVRYLMSAIVRGLWTPEALALCAKHGIAIQPNFRGAFAPAKWRRRWNRALTRAGLAVALARQRGQPVDLD